MLFSKGDVVKGLQPGEWGRRKGDGLVIVACMECGKFILLAANYTMTKTGRLKRPKEVVCGSCGKIFEVELGKYKE